MCFVAVDFVCATNVGKLKINATRCAQFFYHFYKCVIRWHGVAGLDRYVKFVAINRQVARQVAICEHGACPIGWCAGKQAHRICAVNGHCYHYIFSAVGGNCTTSDCNIIGDNIGNL